MTTQPPALTAPIWRTRRAAAIAGIAFSVLLLTAMIIWGIAIPDASEESSLRSDASRRTLVSLSLNLVPFAGIAFLWFIGVVREQLGDIEDRLFSTVFLGSGLLFLGMLFVWAVTAASLLEMLGGSSVNVDVYAFNRNSAQTLVSVYAMRMAAVFTLSVSTLALRTAATPRWVSYVGYLASVVLLLAAGEHRWTRLVFPAWVLLLSLTILLGKRPQRAGAR